MATGSPGLSRRQFLAQGGAAGACLAATRPLRLAAGAARPAKRPNFVFFLTDDQRWDMMGCAGNRIIQTPEMDRLARDGVRFVNAFVTTSICAASRASIFCGLYERTHGYTFGTLPVRLEHVDISYPVLLRQAGYRTGFTGKFGIGCAKGGRQKMFDWWRPMGRGPYFKKQADGSERHLTDLTGDAAVEFLRSCKPDQPFCLSVSFNAPHAEDSDKRQYFWPRELDDLYKDVKIPVPRTADPAFFERQPEFLKESLNRIRWHWRFETPEMAQRMTKGYYRMITGCDRVIGRIRRELQRLGLADNTVVMLMGDNGYFLGERGFAGKWLHYEHSLRVPFLVCDPRLPKALRGQTPKQMALNVDVAPTMLEMAGLPVPKAMQGSSVVPLLQGKAPADWRTDFFCEHLFAHGTIPKYEGVRTERWKYARFFEQQPVHEELYDLAKDFDEEHNLVGDPEHRGVLERLRKRCDELRDAYGGPYKPRPRPPRRPRKVSARKGAAAYVKGVKGKAAAFDGKHYLPAGKTPAIGRDDGFSWSFWVNIAAAGAAAGVIVGNRRLGAGADTVQFMKVTRTMVQYYNTREHAVRLKHWIQPGKWAHVAVVRDGRTLACYVDGKKTASAPVDFDMPALSFYLGGDPHAGELAACQLDEVALYRRALAAADIKALGQLKDVPDGRIGHWPLDGPQNRPLAPRRPSEGPLIFSSRCSRVGTHWPTLQRRITRQAPHPCAYPPAGSATSGRGSLHVAARREPRPPDHSRGRLCHTRPRALSPGRRACS